MSELHSPCLIPIAYPKPDFNIRTMEGKQMIHDQIRKKWVTLTPEEWVRQNFIRYLIGQKHYPPSLMAIEKEIRLNERKKRCDLVVFKDMHPWMIVECKEPQVDINQKVMEQILAYNMALRVPYLVLTNGTNTYAVQSKGESWNYLSALPEYSN